MRTSTSHLRCLLSCKDTNLKAIHNEYSMLAVAHSDVFYLAKILIWKQFTTVVQMDYLPRWCLLSCKDTNLKAIHNFPSSAWFLLNDVFYLAKILIWKQFTTRLRRVLGHHRCLLSCKDTNLKAIHNYAKGVDNSLTDVFYLAKILIWKQFTTAWLLMCQQAAMSSILQRY